MIIDPGSIILVISSLICVALFILILRQRNFMNPGIVPLLGLIAFTFLINIIRLIAGLNQLAGYWKLLQSGLPLYLTFVLAYFSFDLTMTFLRKERLRWLSRGLAAIFLLTMIILLEPVGIIRNDQFTMGRWLFSYHQTARFLLSAGFMLLFSISIYRTITTHRQTVHPLHRNRYLFWLVSLVIFFAGAVLVLLSRTAYTDALFAFGLIILTQILLTHDLPDIRQIARRSLTFIIATILAVTIYTLSFLAFLFASQFFNNQTANLVQALILALVITLLLNPLINSLQTLISRLIIGGSFDPRNLAGEYSKEIANIIDLGHLSTVITATLTHNFNLANARLFTANPADDDILLTEVKGSGEEPNKLTIHLSGANPVVNYFNHEHIPLAQYDIDLLARFKDAPSREKEALRCLSIDTYVPVFIQERWIGLIGLGPKNSGDRFFESELSSLQTFADQTAIALENARLYDDLKFHNSENVRLNYELTAANQELSRLDKAKSDFISIASHELRTPLTQIIGYNDILGDMIDGGNVPHVAGQQMVDGVRKAAYRLEEIVDTMFDVSKMDTRTLDLSMAPASVASLIKAAIEKWSDALEDRKQTIAVRGLSGLPSIQVDGKRMVQVFANLIQNAIKSTPDGGQIRIIGQEVAGEAEQSYVEIAVEDTGIGIAPEELERIFEKFYRVGDTMVHSTGETKFKGAGPGLGLTLCRGIVEAHGGRIWAESPGHNEETLPGAIFHILLPVVSPIVYPKFPSP